MIAIVLGSGLGKFSEYFDQIKSEPFEDFFDVDFETMEGHERSFIWCTYKDVKFLIISGKLHYYEGFSLRESTLPLQYAINKLGVDKFIITSASGGLSEKIKIGEWTSVYQIGAVPQLFNNKRKQYDLAEFNHCLKITGRLFSNLSPVRYAFQQGPSTGSAAEYKMLSKLGADLVGMSMLPESSYLKSLNVDVHFLSVPVCNYYPFIDLSEPSFEEVLKVSFEAVPKLVNIFKLFLQSKKN